MSIVPISGTEAFFPQFSERSGKIMLLFDDDLINEPEHEPTMEDRIIDIKIKLAEKQQKDYDES